MFSFPENPNEPKRQIMPPPPRLRQTSSMIDIDSVLVSNGSQHSQSTLNLNGQIQSVKEEEEEGKTEKLKRKKWYSVFLPPQKDKTEEIEPVKKEKKKKWYKGKKKEKIAVEI